MNLELDVTMELIWRSAGGSETLEEIEAVPDSTTEPVPVELSKNAISIWEETTDKLGFLSR